MARVVTSHLSHIGGRDHLITIERLVETTPDSDFPSEEWRQPFQVWAFRDYVTLEERAQSSQLLASAVMRWEVAYNPELDSDLVDVANKRRVVYKDRIHNIIAAEVKPRNEGSTIVLTTQAKVG
jgi:head-tail adaptor